MVVYLANFVYLATPILKKPIFG